MKYEIKTSNPVEWQKFHTCSHGMMETVLRKDPRQM